MSEKSQTALDSSSKLNASLLRLKFLDCLRNGDKQKLQKQMDEIRNSNYPPNSEVSKVAKYLLHYAVQVAPLSIVQYIVEKGLVSDVNIQDGDGNTPLHLAAQNTRDDIVSFLMSLDTINDCVLNKNKQQPIELAGDIETGQLFSDLRTKFVEKSAAELRKNFESRNFEKLDELLTDPRTKELLDINGTDPVTGDTVLHEYVKRNDAQMVKFIVSHGGDPFKRNVKGKLPIDSAVSSEVKKILKESSKEQNIIDQGATSVGPPTFKGFLKKWTNFAGGYKLRWFILDDHGRLSYFKSPNDINNSCRGSINLCHASLKMDSSEKSKFEIIIVGAGSVSKWHLKANHYIETNRWVWALQNAIRYAKDIEKKRKLLEKESSSKSSAVSRARESFDSSRNSHTYNINSKNAMGHFRTNSAASSVSNSSYFDNEPDSAPVSEVSRKPSKRLEKSSQGLPDIAETHPLNTDKNLTVADSVSMDSSRKATVNASNQSFASDYEDENSELVHGELEEYDAEAEDVENSSDIGEGYQDQFKALSLYSSELKVLQNNLTMELSTFKDLLNSLPKEYTFAEISSNSVLNIERIFQKYTKLVALRTEKLTRTLERQIKISSLWEKEIQNLDSEIRDREERLATLENKQKSLRKVLKNRFSLSGESSKPEVTQVTVTGSSPITEAAMEGEAEIIDMLKDESDDDDDQFFDAEDDSGSIQSGIAPEETVGEKEPVTERRKSHAATLVEGGDVESGTHPLVTLLQREKSLILEKEGSFLGYEDGIRTRLSLSDDRPKISLWGILKSMIGKDMTKMTLPVSFNECTSLLQRVAEDMEYVDLLDSAATFEDSALRLVYVAAFAASEYASTIDRIAKPFNPLLGETYEYARPDRNYRFFVEQVSHHPPIGAAIAESPKWDYFGESAVKSKFYGRSFDIKPLGTWYLNLRPDHGIKEELYTWKKVTSSVVGIITGNPTVDNYGEMKIVNHTTKDSVVLNFKPRGWRSNNAYEVKGEVIDGKGVIRYTIGGHWNSVLYGKHAGPGKEKFVIWRANPRPKDMAFNLTTFAASLNAPQEKLLDWLPQTDTRLRPDQRAMEEGRYDDASVEKNKVEEKQRAARRKREAANQEYKPKWFTLGTHPVTGEQYWVFNNKYWYNRAHHNLKDVPNIF
ncbi:BA75_01564T0 [Komagataella pastoris]|uniref:BA75_01564T0 n=1 Tax=Komagataella pastoris TaxID=4922 RepID=A0A1B2J5V6_PICPA|nr:BA75_01564T0 [Komagataella pastoris]